MTRNEQVARLEAYRLRREVERQIRDDAARQFAVQVETERVERRRNRRTVALAVIGVALVAAGVAAHGM